MTRLFRRITIAVAVAFTACRTQPIAPPQSAPVVPTTQALTDEPSDGYVENQMDRHLADLRFTSARFDTVLGYVADQLGARFDIDWPALHTIGIEPGAPITIRVRDIKVRRTLQLLVKIVEGDTADQKIITREDTKRNVILMTSPAAFAKTAVAVDYDVSVIVAKFPPDQRRWKMDLLKRYLLEHVDSADWKDNGGEVGMIEETKSRPGVLRITLFALDQDEILLVLDELLEQPERLVVTPAPFLPGNGDVKPPAMGL